MAFTAYFCVADSPWIGGNGGIAIGWPAPDSGLFKLTITGTTANGPYSASWQYNVDTSTYPTIPIGWVTTKTLKAGSYTITVLEVASGLTQSFSFTVSDYNEIFVINHSEVQASCSTNSGSTTFSYNTGFFSFMTYCVKITGQPSLPANCNLGAGIGTITKGSSITLSGLPPGDYTIELKNSTACRLSNLPNLPPGNSGPAPAMGGNVGYAYFTISTGTVNLVIQTQITDSICDGNNGAISITSISGTGPYTYQWTGPGGFSSTDSDLEGLISGDYTLVVTDANGCTGTTTVFVDSVPDANDCQGDPLPEITCYKFVNCDPDCFGQKEYFLTGSDVSGLLGYTVNGLQLEGESIDPNACWTVVQSSPEESSPEVKSSCLNLGVPISLFNPILNCYVRANGVDIFTGSTSQANVAGFVGAILSGQLSGGYTATSVPFLPNSLNLYGPSWNLGGTLISIGYIDFKGVPTQITCTLSEGSPGTGCYSAATFIGYNTVFSSCEKCKPVECPVEPVCEEPAPKPVEVFFQIKESKCDITVTKKFAAGYNSMVKKLRYGVTDCCKDFDMGQIWVDKQLTDLASITVDGYNCRATSTKDCDWLPLQGCELLTSGSDGLSILAIAGEDILAGSLVMLMADGRVYLNQPLNITTYQRCVGFATTSVNTNQSLRVFVSGTLSIPTWSLTTGNIYYAGPNGTITSTIPGSGISQMIGVAVNPATLLVEIKHPTIL